MPILTFINLTTLFVAALSLLPKATLSFFFLLNNVWQWPFYYFFFFFNIVKHLYFVFFLLLLFWGYWKTKQNCQNKMLQKFNFQLMYKVCHISESMKNKRTMMVLYRSPEQTGLHTYCWSFTALRFMYKFYSPASPPPPPPPPPQPPQPHKPCFFLFNASWRLDRVTKGIFLPSYIEIGPVVSDKKIFKVFYIAIKP